MNERQWFLALLVSGSKTSYRTTKNAEPFLIVAVGQGSLCFQLLRADGGLYDFGRTMCLLSTVKGLVVPPHNFIAVHNPKTDTENRYCLRFLY